MKKISAILIMLLCTSVLSAQDCGVTGITAPATGCNMTSSQSVTITITNFTGLPLNLPFTLTYQVGTNPIVTENSNLAVGAGGSASYTFATQIPISQLAAQGTYAIVACASNTADGNTGNNCFTIAVTNDALSLGGSISGGTNVCNGSNSGVLTLSGHNGAVQKWQYSTDGGGIWNDLSNTTTTHNYTNLTTQTLFRASVKNGTCGAATSAAATITIDPVTVGGAATPDATVCSGSNSGAVTLSGHTGAVQKWQFSTDNGASWSDIVSSAANHNYLNLTSATRFRAEVKSGACPPAISSFATVSVDAVSVGGSVGANATVCSGSNSGTLTLSGYTGSVQKWQSSTDGGTSWSDISNTGTSQNYANLTQTTLYRAVIVNGVCAAVNSSAAVITVDPVSAGGSVAGGTNVCSGLNSGSVNLTGNTGAVLKWQYSTDGGAFWTDIVNTGTSQPYSNLTTQTMYRAEVKSGVCPSMFSLPATLSIDPVSSGGSVSGSTTVCSGANSGAVTLSGETGAIEKWQYSTDGGSAWTDITNTTNTQSYLNISIATQYRAVVKSGSCAAESSAPALLAIDLPSVGGSVNSNANVCTGSNSGTLTLAGNTGSVVNWQLSTDGGATWNNIPNTGTSQNYTNVAVNTQYRAVVKNGVCSPANSSFATLTVDPVSVGGSVAGDATVCAGTNSGTLVLSGNNGTVEKWQYSTDGGSVWVDMLNTSTTQNYTNLTQHTLYRAVSRSGACAPANSSPATISMQSGAVGGTVSADITVCSGSNAGILTLSGETGTIVKWQLSTDGGISWADISNTSNTQAYNDLTLTTKYRAVIQQGACSMANSSTATVTVSPLSSGGAISGGGAVCKGSNSGALMLSGHTGSVQKWQLSTDGGSTWSDIANASATQTFNNVTVNTLYRAEVKSGVCSAVNSASASLTMDEPSAGGSVSGSTSVCNGSNGGSVSLSGETGLVQKWQFSTDGGSSWTDISNTANTQSYINLSVSTFYRAVVKNASCSAVNSSPAVITIDQPSAGGSVSGGVSVCSGSNSGMLSLSGETGSVVRWQYSTDGGASWTNIPNTLTTYNYNNITVSTQFRAEVKNAGCASAYSSAAAITVTAPSAGGSVSGSATGCSGSNSGSLILSGYTGTVTGWESSSDGGASWSPIINTSTTQSFNNLTVTTRYRALVQNGGCPVSYSAEATVTIDPVSAGGSAGPGATVCSGVNNGVINLTGNTGSVIRWELSTDGGISWSSIANTSTSFSYNNISNTTMYRAVVQNGSCSPSSSSPCTITVTASTSGGTAGPASSNVCSGAGGTLTLSGQVGNVLYWESSSDGGVTWSPIASSSSPVLSYSNITLTTSFRANVQSCVPALSSVAVVNVTPSTVGGSVSGSATVCYGSNAATLTLSGHTGNVVRWESSTDGGTSWIPLSNTGTSQAYSGLTLTTMYRAIVQSGSCAVLSSSDAVITVNPATVAGTVAGSASVCSGSNSGLLSLSGHTGTVLQWESSTDGGVSWTVIPNTGVSESYTNLTVTTLYRARVQSGICAPEYTSPAAVTVNPAPDGGILSGSSVCSGSNGSLNLTGYIGNVINWESSTDGGATWIVISNANDIHNYTNITVTTKFRVKVQGCTTIYSPEATVTVSALPVGGTLNGSVSVCASSNSGILNLSGESGAIAEWQSSEDNGATWSSISNTSDVLLFSNLGITTMYRVRIAGNACADAYSTVATVTVDPVTVGGLTSGSATVCTGSNAGAISLSGYTGAVQRWESSDDGGFLWTPLSNTTNTLNYFNLSKNTMYRAMLKSGTCPGALSTTSTISVSSVTSGGTVIGSTTVCGAGNSGSLSLSGHVGNIVRWESSVNGGATWTQIPNTSGTISFTNLNASTQFRALVQSCSQSYSSVATVQVDAVPSTGSLTGASTVCSGVNSGMVKISSYSGTIQGWEQSADNGNTWLSISNTTNTVNYFNLITTTQYRAIVRNGSCPSLASAPVTINVTPAPDAGLITGAGKVCAGSSGALTLSGYTGNIAGWETSTDGGLNWTFVSDSLPEIRYTDITSTMHYRAVVDGNNCPLVRSSPAVLSVDAQPVAGTLTGTDSPVCSGSNTGIVHLTGYSGSIIRWESSTDNGASYTPILNASQTQMFLNVRESTLYRALIGSGVCEPVYTPAVRLTVNPSPLANFTSSDPNSKTVYFTNASISGKDKITAYEWNFGDNTATGQGENVSHIYQAPGSYEITLKVTTEKGCTDSSTHRLAVNFDTEDFLITNLVTLNENGLNDVWYVENIEKHPSSEVHIFNRYGTEVFYAAPYLNNWDCTLNGNKLPEGTYYYILKIKDTNKTYKGSITVVK